MDKPGNRTQHSLEILIVREFDDDHDDDDDDDGDDDDDMCFWFRMSTPVRLQIMFTLRYRW